MNFISRPVHGALDYVVGLFLLFSPPLFGLDSGTIEARVLMVLGIAAIIYSLCTRYELGILSLIPFRAHLALDAVHAAVLGASPWLFHFSERVWVPHVAIGCMEFVVIGLTLMSGAISDPINLGHSGTSAAHRR